MYLVRDIMYCKPGQVRPMIQNFLAMLKLFEKAGMGKMRVMTDVVAEQYWTIVSAMEVESIDKFMSMKGLDPEVMKQLEPLMKGYHEHVDHGRREIYRIEG